MTARPAIEMMWPVVRILGMETPGAAPAAARAARPGWRDPRLWLGVAIVAVCVLVGTKLLSGADDTVEVWAVSADHPAGSVVTSPDLTVRRVRFGDADTLDGYFRVGERLPGSLRLARGVGGGELLPRAAVARAPIGRLAQLPVAVPRSGVPAGLAAGAAVDVYVVGRPPSLGDRPGRAMEVVPTLARVTVIDLAADDLNGGVTLTLAVPTSQVAAYFAALARADSPAITVVGRP